MKEQVTREEIEQKVAEFKKAKERFLGQINAINGAIQACEDLLKEEEKKEESEEVKDNA